MIFTFLVTHRGSGGDLLCKSLNDNLRICSLGRSDVIYDHPSQLIDFKNKCNLISGRKIADAECYIDHIIYNHQIVSKSFYDICKFIYLIREPIGSLQEIINSGYNISSAENYYLFRLRRICEMITKTPKCVFITYDDLISNKIKKLEDLLELKLNLDIKSDEILIDIPHSIVNNCKKAYEKYFNYLMANQVCFC